MLYFLHELQDELGMPWLDLFRLLTFRAALAALTAFFVALIFGRPVIRLLSRFNLSERAGKSPSDRVNELNQDKEHTPTMGGVMILGAVTISCALFARPDNLFIQCALFVFLGLGCVGFVDDYVKQVRKDKGGLSTLQKLLAQFAIALPPVIALYVWAPSFMGSEEAGTTFLSLHLPFVRGATVGLSFFFLLWALLVLVGWSNAVNLTDGLDGLAIGCTLFAGLAFSILAYVSSRGDFSEYLGVLFIPGAGEISVFCAALVGASLGFLWFNCFPAEVFMGDTGSLPLGGVLGLVAICLRQELLLLIVGGVFVVELISVVLQVFWFKAKGRRFFACAPLHHHFQFRGLPESKVTIRFWILAAILALFSVATLKIG